MKYLALLAGIAAWAPAGGLHAELDLTPRETTIEIEGREIKQTAFLDGETKVFFSPPAGWSLRGAGRRAELRCDTASLASGSIEVRRLPANGTFDPAVLEKLKAEIATGLPREAEGVKWEAPEENPVLMNRHETRRLTVSYSAFAQRFTTTVIICNFATQQVLFRLDTRTDEFAKQYDLFRRSLFTWQGLP